MTQFLPHRFLGDLDLERISDLRKLQLQLHETILALENRFTADELLLGGSSAPTGVICSVFQTSNQAVTANTWTRANLAGVAFDPLGFWDAANSRFKPNVAGYYRVSAELLAQITASGQASLSAVYKNGVSVRRLAQLYNNGPSGANNGTPGSCIVYLNGTTDYLEIFGYTGGVSFDGTASGEYSYADFELVGGTAAAVPEPWHVVGAAGEPAFQNGWVTLPPGSGGGQPTAFYKDPHGHVVVAGWVGGGVAGTVFTLPVGYRTKSRLIWTTQQDGGFTTNIAVEADGRVISAVTKAGGWLSLDCVHFRADQ